MACRRTPSLSVVSVVAPASDRSCAAFATSYLSDSNGLQTLLLLPSPRSDDDYTLDPFEAAHWHGASLQYQILSHFLLSA